MIIKTTSAVKITLAMFVVFSWFGLVGPYCVSAKSDILPSLWIFSTIFAGIVILSKLYQKFKGSNK